MELAVADVKQCDGSCIVGIDHPFGNTYIRAKQVLYKLWKIFFFPL